MGWYILGAYILGGVCVFVSMARTDAFLLANGKNAAWSHDNSDKILAATSIGLWPVLCILLGPAFCIGEVYGWLIRVFTPKPAAPPPPPPTPEPEHIPGDGYRDGGKVCTCGARRD